MLVQAALPARPPRHAEVELALLVLLLVPLAVRQRHMRRRRRRWHPSKMAPWQSHGAHTILDRHFCRLLLRLTAAECQRWQQEAPVQGQWQAPPAQA
mmetsp:Transcript_65735/g.189171  ORF Transcript_65735/g.189171 Transcript_65735/m.189171 type:complete len:97 (-) Transcript_65735:950-1240(-)